MRVEFVGTTGAGKTSLVRDVVRRLAPACRAVEASDLVTGCIGGRRVTHPTLRNLVQEAVGFLPFAWSVPRYRTYLACAGKLLLRGRLSLSAFNRLRAVERALGVQAICKSCDPDLVVLVDEGPVLAAQVLLLAAGDAKDDDIRTFAAAIPWPDVCVWVRVPFEQAVARTIRRPDAPRDLRGCSAAEVEHHVRAASDAFERLLGAAPPGRVLTVENPDASEDGRSVLAGAVADAILARAHSPSALVEACL